VKDHHKARRMQKEERTSNGLLNSLVKGSQRVKNLKNEEGQWMKNQENRDSTEDKHI